MRTGKWAIFGWVFALSVLGAGWTASAETLPAMVVRSVPTLKKEVALTFDDGPTKKWTPEVLRVLDHDHVKATFFIVGTEAVRFPQYLQLELKDHMEIGSHGARHVTLRGKSAAVVEKDVTDNQEILESLGVPKLKLYRLPGGMSDKVALTVLGKLGYVVVGWSVDPRDWRHRYTAEQMTELVVKHTEPGSIIIFHDGPNSSQATVDAVQAIIPRLKQEGYRFVTVGQLIKGLSQPKNRLGPVRHRR